MTLLNKVNCLAIRFLLLACLPLISWGFPTLEEWEALCKKHTHWEQQAQPLLEEPPESLRAWLKTSMAGSNFNDTPLHICARYGNLALLQVLLLRAKARAQTLVDTRNIFNYTPLHDAAINGHTLVVQCLLAHGALASAANDFGMTPLDRAARNGHLSVVQCLLAHGASPTVVRKLGITPLQWAATDGHLPVVQCLLAHGASVTVANWLGIHSLHWAARNGHLLVVQCLLAHGASATVASRSGITPLHWAAMRGHLPVVQSLLSSVPTAAKRNGLIHQPDNNHETPLMLAQTRNHQAIVQYLSSPPELTSSPESLQTLTCFAVWRMAGHIKKLQQWLSASNASLWMMAVILVRTGLDTSGKCEE